MELSIIVAASENNIIGKENQMIWKISEDLKHFRKLTVGNAVIMGRKTYESLGRPLPDRENIVITRNKEFTAEGCTVVYSTEEALEAAATYDRVFIMGGGQLYQEFWNNADKLHLTRVHTQIEGDTSIPEVNDYWKEVERESHKADEKNEYDYTFITYVKSDEF